MPGPWSELRGEPSKLAELAPRLEGAPSEIWLEHADLAACPPGELYFVDATIAGYPSARARCAKKALPVAMTAQRHGGLVLERKLAGAWLQGVPPEQASLRPVQIRDAQGVVSDAYALVEVHKAVPLDRSAAGFEPFDPARPYSSHVAKVGAPLWGEGRQPPARIFRLLELPTAIFVDAELLAGIEAATKGAVAALAIRRREGGMLQPPPWSRAMVGPLHADEDAAARAAEAFWALARGESGAELRAAALTSPWSALALAAALDGGARDDTRAAATGDPHCAGAYARLIDRSPHPATEKAARSHGVSAAAWATRVTAALDDGIAAQMIGLSGAYDAAAVARLRASLAPVQAWLQGARSPQ